VTYVLGRGHSGSTLLGLLLGNSPDAVDIGEVPEALVAESSAWSETTGDGAPFWKRVRLEVEADGLAWSEVTGGIAREAHMRRLPATWTARPDTAWVRRFLALNDAFLGAVARVADRRMVVESSKQLTRGLFLLRFRPGTHAVHLVRHPYEVVASDLYHMRQQRTFKLAGRQMKTFTWEPVFVLLVTLRWAVGTALAELVCALHRAQVVRVRYEDLVERPDVQLERLEPLLGVDLASVRDRVRGGQPLVKGPTLGGNPGVRSTETVVLDARPRGRPLPAWARRLVDLLCWPFLRAYGYGRGAS
jgi:hypothetical protein